MEAWGFRKPLTLASPTIPCAASTESAWRSSFPSMNNTPLIGNSLALRDLIYWKGTADWFMVRLFPPLAVLTKMVTLRNIGKEKLTVKNQPHALNELIKEIRALGTPHVFHGRDWALESCRKTCLLEHTHWLLGMEIQSGQGGPGGKCPGLGLMHRLFPLHTWSYARKCVRPLPFTHGGTLKNYPWVFRLNWLFGLGSFKESFFDKKRSVI